MIRGVAVPILAVLTIVLVIAMLVAYAKGRGDMGAVFKMAASCGFLLTAWSAGAFQSHFGIAIFVGLIFSWFGDLFLIYEGKRAFLAGLTVFLIAHVAYIAAFATRGIVWTHSGASLAILLPFVAVILWWLLPHVHGPMRFPVLAYTLVITSMVAAAAGMIPRAWGGVVLLGAIAFYVSDLFVARGRFVHADHWNGLIGLPLYYGGQILLALSIYPVRNG